MGLARRLGTAPRRDFDAVLSNNLEEYHENYEGGTWVLGNVSSEDCIESLVATDALDLVRGCTSTVLMLGDYGKTGQPSPKEEALVTHALLLQRNPRCRDNPNANIGIVNRESPSRCRQPKPSVKS